MPDQPSPRRRFQFRLRTLMIVVTLLAVACGYIGSQEQIVGQRRAWYVEHPCNFSNGARVIACGDKAQSPGLMRRWLGDIANDAIPLPLNSTPDDRRRAIELFPEAVVVLCDNGTWLDAYGFSYLYVPSLMSDNEVQRLRSRLQTAIIIKRDDSAP
jgi:hypothetical protein